MTYHHGFAQPARIASQHHVRPPAAPLRYVYVTRPLSGYPVAGLGFSLKPPQWVRKLTLKKALVPLAIGAGVALIPGALPLAAKIVTGAGKIVFKGVTAVGRGITGLIPKPVPKVPVAQPPPVTNIPVPTPTDAGGFTINLPQSQAQAAAQSPGGTLPSIVLPGAPGQAINLTTGNPTPKPAGAGNSLVPLAIGAVALLGVSAVIKKRR